MRLGIIGSGVIVKEFLPKLTELEGIDVVAVQGTPETLEEVKTLCKQNNVPHAVSEFEELIQLDIDTVYIAVPNFLHFMYCKKSLEQGLHVIVEKPMTSNLEEAKRLEEIAKEKECFLFEAVTTPYLENFAKIKEWLPKIGNIKLVQSQYCQYSSRYDAFLRGEVLPAFDPKKSGGALMDLNLYNLHMVMDLFGEPEKYFYHANMDRNIDTSGILMMEYPDFQAVCIGAKDCKGVAKTIIQGTEGMIETSRGANVIGKVILSLNDGTKEEFNMGSVETRLIPEFKTFIQKINEKDTDFCEMMLKKSLAVVKVQTNARLQAGIIFPADKQEQS